MSTERKQDRSRYWRYPLGFLGVCLVLFSLLVLFVGLIGQSLPFLLSGCTLILATNPFMWTRIRNLLARRAHKAPKTSS